MHYNDLLENISELHKLKEKHQVYITQDDSKDKPESYLHLVEKIQTPMPFQIFADSHSRSQATKVQDAYLKLETDILNKLRNVPKSHFTNSAEEEAENYELHQQRIINTLKTINESELNLRLAFINLYLQVSKSRIKQEAAPIEKKALLEQTVKFLDANLIPLKPDSFSSEDKAQKYANKLSETIVHIKEINEEFSQSNSSMFKTNDEKSPVNSLYLFKSSLVNKIIEQSEGLIAVKNLKPTAKKKFLENPDLKNILGEDLMTELKNRILKTILEQKNFSSPNSSSLLNMNRSTAVQKEEIFKFIYGQNVSDKNYNQEDLFKIILSNLKESKNDRSFFFKFLNQMTEKTSEIFKKFQNTEVLNDNNQFKEFKNLLLNHFEQPTDDISQNSLTHKTMGKSLLKLMQFKDDGIKEAKYISCLNGLLEPLFFIELAHSKGEKSSVSVYDLFSFTKGDLAERLQENHLIKRKSTINLLERMLEKPIPPKELTDDEDTLHRYAKILDIALVN